MLPNFFRASEGAPEVAQHLWAFARSAYLDNPLPSLFKERLFVHLSRFCQARYCLVRHVGFLLGRGRPAGDEAATPHTVAQVAALLRRPGRLQGAAREAALRRLDTLPDAPRLPEPCSDFEADVFAAATEVFLEPGCAGEAHAALRRALGASEFDFLAGFLAFVHTAHYWTLTRPELAPEEDVEALLRDHEELARLLAEDIAAGQCAISERLSDELAQLRRAQVEHERLDRNAEMLRLALDAADQGAWDYDVGADALTWDRKTYELYGMPADAPLSFSRVVEEVVHPDDREPVRAASRAALGPAGDGRFVIEHRVIHGDGRTHWLSLRGRTLFEGGGRERRARRMLGTVRDVTEAHRAAEALRREREVLQTIFDTIPVMITLYDPEVNLLLLNREFERLTGWSSEDAARTSIMEACYPDPDYREQVRAFMESCRGWMDVHMRTRDGRTIETSWANVRLSDARRVGIGLDITERKAAEDRLRESEQRFRGIYENAGTGIAITDINGRFQSCNRAYAAMLGYSEDELRTIAFEDLLHPEDREQNMEAVRRVLAGEAPSFELLNRYLGKDGKVIWVHKHGSLLRDASGRVTHLIALVTDMTQRKQAEEHRQLLVNELNHRVKNTLAVVQAIAQQTFKGSNSSADLMAAFQNRLATLAAAHTLLTRSNWEQALLEELFRETTAATFAHSERIRFAGPRVVLQPKKAITLAMALHELCTNAMKHGALSVETGGIDVDWEISDGARQAFRLTWRELGGPPVTPPGRKGFGSRMIEQALAQEIDGTVTMDFRPEGLVCTIEGILPAHGAETA